MPPLLLRSAHFTLAIMGLLIWGIGNILYSLCIGLAMVGDWIYPDSTLGNCWAFALARWWKHGGYIVIRKSDKNGFLGFLPLPHILWLRRMNWNNAEVEHLVPVVRKRSKWFPWYAVYFDGRISNTENPHDAEVANG